VVGSYMLFEKMVGVEPRIGVTRTAAGADRQAQLCVDVCNIVGGGDHRAEGAWVNMRIVDVVTEVFSRRCWFASELWVSASACWVVAADGEHIFLWGEGGTGGRG
jgi:hypothetical protein